MKDNQIVQKSGEISYFSIDQKITQGFLSLVQEKTGLEITSDTPRYEIRKAICNFENLMKQSIAEGFNEDTANTYPLKHHFADNIYAREIFIPKGHIVVGRIHRYENLNFLTKGKVTVITEENGIEVLEAGAMMKSPIGVKRLLITHEDTIWTVLHNTKETDLDKIEKEVIAKSFKELGWRDPVLERLKESMKPPDKQNTLQKIFRRLGGFFSPRK